MSKKQRDKADVDKPDDYLPAVYARSFDQAEWYCQLLEDHDIPAIMNDDYEPPSVAEKVRGRGVPVLVPESLLSDARACIRELEDMGEFSADDDDEDEDEEEGEGFGPVNEFHAADENVENEEEDF